MSPEISFDIEAFIVEATSFPNAPHDDQVDPTSQYLVETYLTGGGVTILVPIGRIPLSSTRRQGRQALSPFQKRFVDRQLRRREARHITPIRARRSRRPARVQGRCSVPWRVTYGQFCGLVQRPSETGAVFAHIGRYRSGDEANPGTVYDPELFRREILPRPASVKLSAVVEATGMTKASASDI